VTLLNAEPIKLENFCFQSPKRASFEILGGFKTFSTLHEAVVFSF
jgi:hypothetical protein